MKKIFSDRALGWAVDERTRKTNAGEAKSTPSRSTLVALHTEKCGRDPIPTLETEFGSSNRLRPAF